MAGKVRRGHLLGARRTVVLALSAVVALVLLVTIGVVVRVQSSLSVVTIHDDDRAVSAPADQDPLTILVVGSDSRALEGERHGVDDGSRRSDALIVVHLARGDARVDAVQIPRDTVLELPACPDVGEGSFDGGRGMINGALNHGLACTVAAVEALSGLHLDHAVELDFDGFVAVVDAIGGLPICLPEPMQDDQAALDLPAGEQVLTGTEALALVRTRHAVGDGSDLARLDNQKRVISALVAHLSGEDLTRRPDRLARLAEAVAEATTVDDGLGSVAALVALGRRFAAVPDSQVSVTTMPWQPAPDDHNRVVPAPEAADAFARLGQDRPVRTGSPDDASPRDPSTPSTPAQPPTPSDPSSKGPTSCPPSAPCSC